MLNLFSVPSSVTPLPGKKNNGPLKRGALLLGAGLVLGTLTACGGTSEAETAPATVTVTSSVTETVTTTKTVTTKIEPTPEETTSTTTEVTTEPAHIDIDPDTDPAAYVDLDKPHRVDSVPTPAPASASQAPAPAPAPVSTYYKNCSAARAAGAAPVYAGSPGYGKHLDRDGDGIGCE